MVSAAAYDPYASLRSLTGAQSMVIYGPFYATGHPDPYVSPYVGGHPDPYVSPYVGGHPDPYVSPYVGGNGLGYDEDKATYLFTYY